MAYKIEYTESCEAHLLGLSARDRSTVIDTVERQLSHQPNVPTRNRKTLRSNVIATWELRIGTLRVYYDVEEEPEATVYVNAVGVKRGSRVFISGEEVDLS